MRVLREVDLGGIIDKYRPDLEPLEKLYRHIHASPELSGQEEETAAIAARHLEALDCEVHERIGGCGVVGVFRNGPGPTLLVRADMDALPVPERTGLPYASHKTMKDLSDGVIKPTMHACGHDTHVTSLIGAAILLNNARTHWKGTLICLFQPAEESIGGAEAMVRDGLYDKIPKPDLVLAQHVMRYREGMVGLRVGNFLTSADTLEVRIWGKGGHGSAPHACIDPIVIAASIVTRLQTVVSREVTPGELGVVTCGCLQAGTAANIIPDFADLKLTIRAFHPAIRERILMAVCRIINAECEAGGAVQKPLINKVSSGPPTINDEKVVRTLKTTFAPYFKDNLFDMESSPASEDFSVLATSVGAAYAMWSFGGTDAKVWDDAVANGTVDNLPINHSPYFAPVIEPTLKTGIDAMALAALTFLGR